MEMLEIFHKQSLYFENQTANTSRDILQYFQSLLPLKNKKNVVFKAQLKKILCFMESHVTFLTKSI